MAKNILVLVDHRDFAQYDSIYDLVLRLSDENKVNVYLSSRGRPESRSFWFRSDRYLLARQFNDDFSYGSREHWFRNGKRCDIKSFDGILLRLDPPIHTDFLNFLCKFEADVVMINRPSGLLETASKEFLKNFSDLIPGFEVCKGYEAVVARSGAGRAVVFKPFYGLGGRGIISVRDGAVWAGQ